MEARVVEAAAERAWRRRRSRRDGGVVGQRVLTASAEGQLEVLFSLERVEGD